MTCDGQTNNANTEYLTTYSTYMVERRKKITRSLGIIITESWFVW